LGPRYLDYYLLFLTVFYNFVACLHLNDKYDTFFFHKSLVSNEDKFAKSAKFEEKMDGREECRIRTECWREKNTEKNERKILPEEQVRLNQEKDG
jgi:hypothetical protein